MKTVACRMCGGFHKKRSIGKAVLFCHKCGELVCRTHTTPVMRPDPYSFDKTPKLREFHVCKNCMAEEALVPA